MKKENSVFRGVRFDPRRRRWMARVRAARFHQQYPSEMEAVAHYNAVARLMWPDEESIERLEKINNPWKGRPDPPRGWNSRGQRVIDIDHDFFAVVDYDPTDPDCPYFQFKDETWFVRNNQALRIHACRLIDGAPWAEFDYMPMEYYIFGGPCVHLNGHSLDNRLCNLITPAEAQAGRFEGVISPLTSKGLAEFRKRVRSPRRLKFLRQLREFRRYEAWLARPVGAWVGEIPGDPRASEDFQEFRDLEE